MNINNNNVNFTARMDVNAIKGATKERWNNIAKIFNETTPKYDGYKFELRPVKGELELDVLHCSKGYSSEHEAIFPREVVKKMMEMSDADVAQKFKKLLGIYKSNDKTDKAITKLLNSLSRMDKYGTLDKATKNGLNRYDEIYGAVLDKIKDDRTAAVAGDEILSNLDFIGI